MIDIRKVRYMGTGQKSAIDSKKRWKKKNPEKAKETHRRLYCEYWERNKDEINKKKREHRKEVVCDIIKKHHEDMKDDPESLTTEFIQKIVNIKCDD